MKVALESALAGPAELALAFPNHGGFLEFGESILCFLRVHTIPLVKLGKLFLYFLLGLHDFLL